MTDNDAMTMHLTRTRSNERAQFLTDTLTTAIEGGINYWAQVLTYRWNDETPDAQASAYAKIVAEDDDDELEVTLDVVARGWGLFTKTRWTSAYWQQDAKLANRTNGEDGDYDADIADVVVQLGLFGEVIYG